MRCKVASYRGEAGGEATVVRRMRPVARREESGIDNTEPVFTPAFTYEQNSTALGILRREEGVSRCVVPWFFSG